MKNLWLVCLLLATPAFGEDIACRLNPDRLIITDKSPGVVSVEFYNSPEECSDGLNQLFTTPHGVTIRVIIEPNSNKEASLERLTVLPQTDGYFAFPPEVTLKDGESWTILVMAGMA